MIDHVEAFAELDDVVPPRTGVSFPLLMSGEKFERLINYKVIVEMWEHKKYGRVKRRWTEEFTETERAKIGRYHTKFFKWALRTGTPTRVLMKAESIQLLVRAVNFFAAV